MFITHIHSFNHIHIYIYQSPFAFTYSIKQPRNDLGHKGAPVLVTSYSCSVFLPCLPTLTFRNAFLSCLTKPRRKRIKERKPHFRPFVGFGRTPLSRQLVWASLYKLHRRRKSNRSKAVEHSVMIPAVLADWERGIWTIFRQRGYTSEIFFLSSFYANPYVHLLRLFSLPIMYTDMHC
jgi:hypothetical protein